MSSPAPPARLPTSSRPEGLEGPEACKGPEDFGHTPFLTAFSVGTLESILTQVTPCVQRQWDVIGPTKPVQALVGENVKFSCFLSPETNAEGMEVRFFKNQFSDVVHIYMNGKDQKHMQMPAYRGRTELMKDFITKGHVSLTLEMVTSLDAGVYGCWFSSQTYYQEAVWELQVSGQLIISENS
ncbi:PREDICTED: butyrophilin-like protein 8-like [Chrysochloris asiatica]|uniref:Butyrophilin-like protein 8-like n=1 Tax=Chrysochloris asiatica TaxID=185453 RepID=A0A9B0UDY1_CHRAS|nr:PREDICTED: butyrophilin-like protein 8-like [Chrysochloris asiatica]